MSSHEPALLRLDRVAAALAQSSSDADGPDRTAPPRREAKVQLLDDLGTLLASFARALLI
jgi:hypothetical protein